MAHHTRYGEKGIDHWRGVVYRSPGTLVVWDCLEGEGVHELELNWQCNGEIEEFSSGGGPGTLIMAPLDAQITIAGGRVSRQRGMLDPPRGWLAPQYGRLTPITTLTATATTFLPHEFVTVVELAAWSGPGVTRDVEIFRSWLP